MSETVYYRHRHGVAFYWEAPKIYPRKRWRFVCYPGVIDDKSRLAYELELKYGSDDNNHNAPAKRSIGPRG